MRGVAVIAALLALGASPLAPPTASAAPARVVLGQQSPPVLVAEGCGRGWHWVGGHRDRRTHRWIRGHCARNR